MTTPLKLEFLRRIASRVARRIRTAIRMPLIRQKRKIVVFLYSNPQSKRLIEPRQVPSLLELDPEAKRDPNPIISRAITQAQPFMVGRFGSYECGSLAEIKHHLNPEISPSEPEEWWAEREAWTFFEQAYVYPYLAGDASSIKFLWDSFIEAAHGVDLLASWSPGEALLSKELSQAKLCHLHSIEPYYSANPWSASLVGKKVLVVHTMVNTIRRQYEENRERLFEDRNLLPEFEIDFVRPFMDGLNPYRGSGGYKGLFHSTLERIRSRDFDVAIIGAGTVGFPLAYEVKKMGKVAVHLGGATQLLFGIRGRRWEDQGFKYFNRYWTRPLPEDVPENSARILDKGAYW